MRTRSSTPLTLLFTVALGAFTGVGACSAPPASNGYVELSEQLKAPFENGDVAPAIGMKCGTLDCHGNIARNMRIYSQYGLRMALNDTPGGMPITPFEVDADYRSVSGLEPEIMDQVIADGGANPERLTLIRKARGTEHHKGGAVVQVGDPMDICLTTWLTGSPNKDACDQASQPPAWQ